MQVLIAIMITAVIFLITYSCIYCPNKTDDDQQEKWIRDYSIRKKSENRK